MYTSLSEQIGLLTYQPLTILLNSLINLLNSHQSKKVAIRSPDKYVEKQKTESIQFVRSELDTIKHEVADGSRGSKWTFADTGLNEDDDAKTLHPIARTGSRYHHNNNNNSNATGLKQPIMMMATDLNGGSAETAIIDDARRPTAKLSDEDDADNEEMEEQEANIPAPPPLPEFLSRIGHQSKNPDLENKNSGGDGPSLITLYWDKMPIPKTDVDCDIERPLTKWKELPLTHLQAEADLMLYFVKKKAKYTKIKSSVDSRACRKDGRLLRYSCLSTEGGLSNTTRQRVGIFLTSKRISLEKAFAMIHKFKDILTVSQMAEIWPDKSELEVLTSSSAVFPDSFVKDLLNKCPTLLQRLFISTTITQFKDKISVIELCLKDVFACADKIFSGSFVRTVLSLVLAVGNRLNSGTRFGNASAFKLDILGRLSDVRSEDGSFTLLQFLVEKEFRCDDYATIDGFLDLRALKRASGTHIDRLQTTIDKLTDDIEKAMEVMDEFVDPTDDFVTQSKQFLTQASMFILEESKTLMTEVLNILGKCCEFYGLAQSGNHSEDCSKLFGPWTKFMEDFAYACQKYRK